MLKRTIAVYDTTTGIIRQTVVCSPRDAGWQHHGFDGHASLDVTGHAVDPDVHAIDPATKAVIARVYSLDDQKAAALRAAGQQFEADVMASILQTAMAAQNATLVAAQNQINAATDATTLASVSLGAT